MWTLLNNGQTKSFAEWGLSQLKFSFSSAAVDVASFVSNGVDFDSAPQFAYDSEVVIFRDGVRWFVGRVSTLPRSGGPAFEQVAYELRSPWWFLQRIVFQQPWRDDEDGHTETQVILGKDIDDEPMTCGAVIQEVLDWAISEGAGFSYIGADLAALDIVPPSSEETDLTCEEAVARMLRWHKDVATQFDFSTSPPTLRFVSRADAVNVSVDVNAGDPNHEVRIQRRTDLQVRGVVLNFVQTNTVDDRDYRVPTVQSAGATSGLDILRQTIELSGYQKTTQKQEVETIDLGDYNEVGDLFEATFPEFREEGVLYVQWISVETDSSKHRILKSGLVADWMNKDVEQAEIRATAIIHYTSSDGRDSVEVSRALVDTLTEARTRTYSRTTSYESAEPIPEGLALKIYNQLKDVQFDGSFSFLQVECTGVTRPGQTFCITGGRADWETMCAQVQEVSEDIDRGFTTVTFGPANHLTAQDFIELIRANRLRKKTTQSAIRKYGYDPTGGATSETAGVGRNTISAGGGGSVEVGPGDQPEMVLRVTPTGSAEFGWLRLIVGTENDETEEE